MKSLMRTFVIAVLAELVTGCALDGDGAGAGAPPRGAAAAALDSARRIESNMPTGSFGKYEETTVLPQRYTRHRPTLDQAWVDDCDFEALTCMRAFKTGVMCGRTGYFTYDTFRNACEMDYVNCFVGMERWMVVHMGECLDQKTFGLAYDGDETYRSREDFLNNDYVVPDI